MSDIQALTKQLNTSKLQHFKETADFIKNEVIKQIEEKLVDYNFNPIIANLNTRAQFFSSEEFSNAIAEIKNLTGLNFKYIGTAIDISLLEDRHVTCVLLFSFDGSTGETALGLEKAKKIKLIEIKARYVKSAESIKKQLLAELSNGYNPEGAMVSFNESGDFIKSEEYKTIVLDFFNALKVENLSVATNRNEGYLGHSCYIVVKF